MENWLYPNGFNYVVRRFSSKEEPRRVMAGVVDPGLFAGAEKLGFENHLNLYQAGRRGLPESLARGLAVYLNSTLVDAYFRRFNGHTQVNATDLKSITYPSYAALVELGEWAMLQAFLTKTIIDTKIEKLLDGRNE